MSRVKKMWMISICTVFACAEARAVVLQEIVLTLDVSGSIDNVELQTEITGLKACLNNTSTILQDGSVAVGIVVYGTGAADVIKAFDPTGPSLIPVTCDTEPGASRL